eukprot:CAMPEP_0195649942 /NCGR_PEP_ID=MMETSP0815-20121206/31457_1 /TAXON_ID=97485 /ORGANISM="Prymnesium parvum, Strain Texoma1" /LENGTH=706 /DNA_ID=CAMNT_0040793723 /DNA_START=14 /DNA_END=2135 /DNA_ORIENTATION=-
MAPKKKSGAEVAEKPPKKKAAPPDDDDDGGEADAPPKKRARAPRPSKPYRRPDFGETVFAVAYAASSRSCCKACGEKIAQGEVRLGTITPGEGDYDLTAWSHLRCRTAPLVVSEDETIGAAEQIEGFCDVAEEDQRRLVEWFGTLTPQGGAPSEAAEAAGEGKGTYIDCPFRERAAALSLGGRWDGGARRWYVPFGVELAPFARWFPAGADAARLLEEHAAAATGEALDPAAVPGMKVADLKRELQARGQEASGKKPELAERLAAALTAEAAARKEKAAAKGNAGRGVDRSVPGRTRYAIHAPYDVKLATTSIDGGYNLNKFYNIQVLRRGDGSFAVWNKWGRVGEAGEGKLYPFADEEGAIRSFEAKFKDKTRNEWQAYVEGNFVKHEHKYGVVETEEAADGVEAAPLGKLTEAQIHKGQAVLARLKQAVEAAADGEVVAALSSEYYSLVPTASVGRQAPPPLSTLEMIEAKEGQLDFWLRMGFEGTKSLTANPLLGLWNHAVPPTLKAACSPHGVSDANTLSKSVARGKTLHKKKAGNPIRPMDPEKYGSIVLYTGQSIYRELNKALREDHACVAKFLSYLRLLFEAIACMPPQSVRLWRGIAADLYDEYEVGSVVTWWSVSSCTSDEQVARDFMTQLGGDATLITLDAKSALDITPLSVYKNEKESLLAPGTQLRVVSRAKEGKVAHIHVEEVGTALEPRPAA